MSRLIRNALQTPDGTILESRDRHDYKTYTDTINGETYMVDGGLDYCRRSNMKDATDLNVYFDESPHEKVREALTWGTYGKNGDDPYTEIKLKDMTNDHIRACLRTQHNMYPQVRGAMINELLFRGESYTELKKEL